MILKDDTIILRAIGDQDAEVLMDLINDPDIENSVCGWSYPVSLSSQKQWITNLNDDSTVRYAIELDRIMVGVAIISKIDFKNRTANIGIKLLKDVRGRGIATRAITLLVSFCFEELNLHLITANVLDTNHNSIKLWERLGFSRDGILRDRIFKMGQYHNILAYSLLKEEFYERNWK